MRNGRNIKGKALLVMLVLSLVLGLMPFETAATAPLPDLNDATIYYTPDYKSGECILSSCKCMFRRAAIMRGSQEWDTITNKALRGIATTKKGLFRNSFSYTNDGITYKVNIQKLTGKKADRLNTIANLLLTHPEGIIVWGKKASKSGAHGVLVTACDRGVLYAADSVNNTHGRNKGITPWSSTTMKSITKSSHIWCIESINGVALNIPQTGDAASSAGYVKPDPLIQITKVRAPESIQKGSKFAIRGKLYSLRKMKRVRVQVLDANGTSVIKKTVKLNKRSYNLKKVDKKIKFSVLDVGTYTYRVKAKTSRGWETLVENGFTVY
jgi:hypothetical protein